MTTLAAQDVTFGYSQQPVLQSVSFSASSGEFLVLLGINGAGKSTLLDILAGIRPLHAGRVLLDGGDLLSHSARARSRAISPLPQGTRPDQPFTVEQMVLIGRDTFADRWFESDEDHHCAEDAMRRMNCQQFRERRFSTLSGGEQQRVLLAACLAQRPSILLFDEPSTYLDIKQQLDCFATLAHLTREGALCIAVTHDLNLALAHCSRLLVLDGGHLAADLRIDQASAEPAWLRLLSPRLRVVHEPGGRPWVHYR